MLQTKKKSRSHFVDEKIKAFSDTILKHFKNSEEVNDTTIIALLNQLFGTGNKALPLDKVCKILTGKKLKNTNSKKQIRLSLEASNFFYVFQEKAYCFRFNEATWAELSGLSAKTVESQVSTEEIRNEKETAAKQSTEKGKKRTHDNMDETDDEKEKDERDIKRKKEEVSQEEQGKENEDDKDDKEDKNDDDVAQLTAELAEDLEQMFSTPSSDRTPLESIANSQLPKGVLRSSLGHFQGDNENIATQNGNDEKQGSNVDDNGDNVSVVENPQERVEVLQQISTYGSPSETTVDKFNETDLVGIQPPSSDNFYSPAVPVENIETITDSMAKKIQKQGFLKKLRRDMEEGFGELHRELNTLNQKVDISDKKIDKIQNDLSALVKSLSRTLHNDEKDNPKPEETTESNPNLEPGFSLGSNS